MEVEKCKRKGPAVGVSCVRFMPGVSGFQAPVYGIERRQLPTSSPNLKRPIVTLESYSWRPL